MAVVYAADFVRLCLAQSGEKYVYGAEVDLNSPNPAGPWDCSELVQWATARLGVPMPDGSAAQQAACRRKGTLIPVAQAVRTQGALLFRPGHVAISLGNGSTIEARGKAYGVGSWSSTVGRDWDAAGRVPGLTYGPPPKPPGVAAVRWPGRFLTQPPTMRLTVQEARIQTRLKEIGLYKGRVDQEYGPGTEAAVVALQKRKGLRVDGIVGEQTWTAAFH